MKIIVNADDFANSLNMSEIICECFIKGSLNSTSIMINSIYLDESLKKLSNLIGIRTSLHLNIAEGKPISQALNIKYLLDSNGNFYKSFENILFDYYLGNRVKKDIIKEQIKEEYKNQILLYSKKISSKSINLDSHQYYHTIPFISDILIELNNELNIDISYIRVPKEPFFIEISSFGDLKNYFELNIVKHFLLNFLSNQLIKKLKKNNIGYSEIFIGVLFTGNMTFGSIKKALFNYTLDKNIEILLHPAYLSNEERLTWKDDKFKKFYTDENRKKEMNILMSNDFKKLIKNLKKGNQ